MDFQNFDSFFSFFQHRLDESRAEKKSRGVHYPQSASIDGVQYELELTVSPVVLFSVFRHDEFMNFQTHTSFS